MLIVRYSATAEELTSWATAPLHLDVTCYLLEKTITADDGHETRLIEGWFSEEEVTARIQLLKAAGVQTAARGRLDCNFCATPESMKEREDYLACINGDPSKFLRSASDLVPSARTLARDPRIDFGAGSARWMLLAYFRPEVQRIADHCRATLATYAEQVQLGWFSDQNSACEAGRQLLAADSDAFGFLTWLDERDTSTTVTAPAGSALLS